MLTTATHRPRNVDSFRAASILYGDLGTSKAYVIGLAFALTGYSSFWLIVAVSALTILIGLNYIIICKLYPNGGGVYASVRNRSQIISMIGAFFLTADYLVTAALSALSAFSYFGVSDPILFSAIFIGVIGAINYFGPRHSGTFAFVIAICAVTILTILALFAIPHLPAAWRNIQPLKGSGLDIWKHFVGVIVALSGIEAIANATGVMRLNPGTTELRPLVTRTSTGAIIPVIIEVAVYTSFFAFVTAAITDFQIVNGNVNAPGNPGVRDYMLKYLSEVFVGSALGATIGHWFALVLSVIIGILLLSAVNTAMIGLISLQYIMAGDGELPPYFQKINRFGVPTVPLLVATIIPMILVISVRNVAGLAALYAIGFVGAIATNLGSTSTDMSMPLKLWQRLFMFISFLIMAAVEITLFIDKPEARLYALAVIVAGLLLRGFSRELREKRLSRIRQRTLAKPLVTTPPKPGEEKAPFSILYPGQKPGKALKSALEKASKNNYPLYVLYVREQEVISDQDLLRTWENDDEAVKLYEYAQKNDTANVVQPLIYSITDSLPDIIAAHAERLDVKQIYIDIPTRGPLLRMFKGSIINQLQKKLPPEIIITFVA